MITYSPDSPEGRRAIAEANDKVGFDVTAVLSSGQWKIGEDPRTGRPAMVINRSGLLALAALAPDQDRAARAVALLDAARDGGAA